MRQTHPDDQVFIEGSTIARHHVKRRLMKSGQIKYECARCSNPGTWQGERLSLHLDHINGIHNDNRLSNLRFLCPNCHALTETYAGKNSSGLRTFGKTKPNFKAEKAVRDQEKWKCVRVDIDFSRYGWKTKLAEALNISPQKVDAWLSRVDPTFNRSLV
jgi:5-methylcytosine-specific restriction endonuclease McrA